MLNHVERYKSYVGMYCDLIYSKVALKLGIYKAHVEALERESYDMTRANPLIHLMIESIQIDCVMTVSKLIEHGRGDRTFQKFLTFVGRHIKAIHKTYPNIEMDLVEKQQKSLASIESQIGSILIQRDKYFAHADKEYFFEPNKIIEDFPNTYDELAEIIRVLQGIIGEHKRLMTGSYPICMAGFAYVSSDKMLNHIIIAEKKWHQTHRDGEEW